MAKNNGTTTTAPATDSSMVQLATRIPAELHRSVKLYCVSNGVSMGDFIATCLNAGIQPAAKVAKGK